MDPTREPESVPHRTHRVEIAPKTFLLGVLTVAACWVSMQLLAVVLVVVTALFIVGTVNPAVRWLEHRGVRRGRAIALVFSGMFIATGLFCALTVPALFDQVRSVVEHEPEIRSHIADLLARSRFTASLSLSLRHMHYDSMFRDAAGTALALSTRAVTITAYCVSAIFLALYIIIDRDRLRGGLYAMVPRRHHIRLSRVLLSLEAIVGGYIRGQAITSALMTAFVFALLVSFRVDNPLAIASFAGLADVLPYVGVFLSVAPTAIAVSSHGFVAITVVVAVMLAYEEFESRFLVPRIYGRALRLPSSIILFALLVGGTLMGIVGALLALPVAAAIRMLMDELRVELPGERLNDERLRERDDRAALAEREYSVRSTGIPAEAASAIAVQISEKCLLEEAPPSTR